MTNFITFTLIFTFFGDKLYIKMVGAMGYNHSL